jgi:hypothetical protein
MNRLASARADELLRHQEELQAEARWVIADLDLFGVLSRAGTVRLIGSAASGLMVWRDIDLQVLSSDLRVGEVWEIIRPLATHPQVQEVRFLNQSETGAPSGESRHSRYYFQVFYRAGPDRDWKLDISFWLSGDPRDDEVEYVDRLARLIDSDTRLAILWIKGLWVQGSHRRDPAYGREVSSLDVYDAVPGAWGAHAGGLRRVPGGSGQTDALLRPSGLGLTDAPG